MAKKKATAATDPHLAHKRRQRQILFGSFLLLLGVLLLVAFTSYLFHWKADQSTLGQWGDDQVATENMVRKLGAWISHQMIAQGVGISAYIMALLISYTGLALFFNRFKTRLIEQWAWGMVYMLWLSLAFGFFATQSAVFSGTLGFELFNSLDIYIGQWGILSLLLFALLCVLVLQWKITPEAVYQRFKSASADEIPTMDESVEENSSIEVPLSTTSTEDEITLDEETPEEDVLTVTPSLENTPSQDDIAIEVNTAEKEESLDSNLAQELVEKHGFFDPKLELSKYRFPTLDLLKDYGEGSITINQEELEQNKTKIVNTLKNYNIGIAQIKATIGPTVTLYEIVPDAGIRISKIKNLEDDIALSLSALGIRIIAPIPGKGTIGIEVPNQSATIVSMRSVIASPKFQKAEMELPIALGKTISNETFVVDLTKMPHLLMAGATGQGKSVGLNAVLTSLLYKKHPAEVKFVLIDPKKVELTIYNKIERHYLAKLPDTEEAIITDTTKVINTLNSLCIEMDNRYDLLKNALCRNLKEYNKKFKERKLNPNDGHDYLPYIVLVIDEFADLIMTAGKEVETPIARLAQLARAVGIHLIIATQRPSVNVITGIIKANFPARIAFRVTSKIDSRTILDSGGADQLIGRGDLLYTQGNDLTRIQCAFVDTHEVDKIAEFIGAQKRLCSSSISFPNMLGKGKAVIWTSTPPNGMHCFVKLPRSS